MATHATAALPVAEILRAEWVARVSALDLYVHELVAQGMQSAFEGTIPRTPRFLAFQLPLATVERIRVAPSPTAASAAFNLEVRRQLAFSTFQDPEKIADGLRLYSNVELWNAIAINQGATEATKTTRVKQLKSQLRAIVDRRNKIAHEGDMQPAVPVTPWPIAQADLAQVSSFIEKLVNSMEACV